MRLDGATNLQKPHQHLMHATGLLQINASSEQKSIEKHTNLILEEPSYSCGQVWAIDHGAPCEDSHGDIV